MFGVKRKLIAASVALGACAPAPAESGPAVYRSVPSGIVIEVWDDGSRLAFRYDGDQVRHDGDAASEGRVRCGYVARNPVCVITDPAEGQREQTFDGGFVVASQLEGERWRFLYHPVRWAGDDCTYVLWSTRRGVEEFGPTACLGVNSHTTVWTLDSRRGFF